jgi:RNase P subunit RPR2
MSEAMPGDETRWRCGACGNLTRFDRSARVTEFWHFDLAGGYHVEETTTEESRVESVTCRWCGRGDSIEVVARVDAALPASDGPA